MSKLILITGANGKVSSAVLASLKGTKHIIRAMVRTEEKAAALRATGLDVVIGDFDTPSSLGNAFEGVNTAWVLSFEGAGSALQSSNAVWAARQAGVSHIVRMSAMGTAHNAPTINSRLHAMADAELIASGIPYTILRPQFFMQNLMASAKSVANDGVIAWALGDGCISMIDVRDVGAFAARVLTSGGHVGKIYNIAGPQSINMTQVAEQLGTAIKKTVTYQPLTMDQQLAGFAQMGMDAFGLNMYKDYLTAFSDNWGDVSSSDFQNLMGKAPRSFADFACDFSAAFAGS